MKRSYVFPLFFSLVFILLTSVWGSPLYYKTFGADSSFFSMIGRLILDGKVMYRDYVDVKGPVFFFWEAFGQLFFKGRTGVFFIECICILFTEFFLCRFCDLKELSRGGFILVHVVFYTLLVGALWGGNTLEEYVLPLLLACTCITLGFLKNGTYKNTEVIFMGLAFGICLFSKVTVSAPIIAVVLFISQRLIKEKRFKELGKCAALFAAGILIIAVPVLAWYAFKGALGDMLEWSFHKAFLRAVDTNYDVSGNEFNDTGLKMRLLCMLPVICALLTGISLLFQGKKSEDRDAGERGALLTLMSALVFDSLWFGTSYIYYYIMELPVVILTVAELYTDLKAAEKSTLSWARSRAVLVMLLISCIVFARDFLENLPAYRIILTTNATELIEEQLTKLYSVIPGDEKEDVLYLSPGPMFFEVNGIVPNTRCPNNLGYFCDLDEGIYSEVKGALEGPERPKWIVTGHLEELGLPEIQDLVKESYSLYAKGDLNNIYILKTEKPQ